MAKKFTGKVPAIKQINTTQKAGYVATKPSGEMAGNEKRSKTSAPTSRGTANTRVETAKPNGNSGMIGGAKERTKSTVANRDKSFLGQGSTKTAKPKK